jgi:hypothetical protein
MCSVDILHHRSSATCNNGVRSGISCPVLFICILKRLDGARPGFTVVLGRLLADQLGGLSQLNILRCTVLSAFESLKAQKTGTLLRKMLA